jgi:mannose-1-phosphate guanylyltransferase
MLHAVIMAGGSGTRFWPVSRKRQPKQLLPITGAKAMLAETVDRLDGLIPPERTWVVTHALQADGVRKICPGLPADNILIEPCARNTAACIGLAAALIQKKDPSATLAVLPADHLIAPARDFRTSLEAGAEIASEEGVLVTFGVPPTYPATGYGYIQRGESVGDFHGLQAFEVRSFKEKPNETKAEEFLADGNYAWNSGIFVWRADSILNAIERHMPQLRKGLQTIQDAGDSLAEVIEDIYPTLKSVPVDIGILERADKVRVLETPYHWSDVGSWKALFDESKKDENNNAGVFPDGGQLLAEKSTGILAYSGTPQTIAVLGLDDVVVVHTKDAILVARRDASEDVKKIVDALKENDQQELL